MSPDQFAGSLICVLSIAFVAIGTAYTYVTRGARHELETLDLAYADDAGHEAWVRGHAIAYEPGQTPMYEQLCVDRWERDLGGAS